MRLVDTCTRIGIDACLDVLRGVISREFAEVRVELDLQKYNQTPSRALIISQVCRKRCERYDTEKNHFQLTAIVNSTQNIF